MAVFRVPRLRETQSLTTTIVAAAVAAAACGSTSTESVTGPLGSKCSVSLTAPAGPIGAGGGAGSVVVATQPECAWTPNADATWIADVTPARGQGSGEVQFTADANPNGTSREAGITVNGQRAVIRQAASPCQVAASVSHNSLPAVGGNVIVSVSAPGGCPWMVLSQVGWLSVSPTAGAGSGSVALNVAANSGPERSGTLTVGGLTINITQESAPGTAPGPGPAPAPGPAPGPEGPLPPAPSCSISLQPSSASMPPAGGSGTVLITTNPGCAWVASSAAQWISVTTPTSGSGSGSIGFTVAANGATTGRVGSMSISGATFTVSQAGTSGQTCTFAISPTSQSVSVLGGAFTVSVTTQNGCQWTAASNASWVTITGGGSGAGSGSVTYGVGLNLLGSRSATLTIAGRTLTVNQAGVLP